MSTDAAAPAAAAGVAKPPPAPPAAAAAAPAAPPPPAPAAAAATSKVAVAAAAPAAAAVRQPAAQPAAQPRPAQPAAAAAVTRVAPVDAVIDEVLGGDLCYRERELAADQVAYNYFTSIREAAGGEMDAETSAKLNQLAAMAEAEKAAILQKTNRVARKVLRPLGYKMLQVQGLDPATVNPAAARAALEAELTPQQQAVVDAEAERLFKQVYLPELQSAAQDLELQDPDEAWEAFGRDILSRQPEEPQQQSTAAVAVPAALAGAVVALVVSKLLGWLQRRRQRNRSSEMSGSDYYEEEEVLTHTDSGQDDASAYAE